MAPSSARGRCYCGHIRFTAELPPRFVAHCHCETCRRAHGAGAVTWAGFREQQVKITGGEELLGRYHTETGATRSFCTRCGAPLFFQSPRWAGELHIARAHFEDPLEQLPAAHSYADRAPDWFPIHDGLPQYGGTSGSEKLETC